MLIELVLATTAVAEFTLTVIESTPWIEDVSGVVSWAIHIAVGLVLALVFSGPLVLGLAAAGGSAALTAIIGAVSRYPAVPMPNFRR